MSDCFKKIFLTTTLFLSSILLFAVVMPLSASAAGMKNINVANGSTQSTITITFDGKPDYAFFPLHNPERVVIDVKQSGVMKGLPLNFNGQNLVTRVRSSNAQDAQSQRLVFELTDRKSTRLNS